VNNVHREDNHRRGIGIGSQELIKVELKIPLPALSREEMQNKLNSEREDSGKTKVY